MIIDQIRHAGLQAYLVNRTQTNPAINLAPALATGTSREIAQGKSLDVSALDILVDSDQLSDLFQHQPNPILSVSVNKELFPGLFVDPYASRVHLVGGSEDFRRGNLQNLRSMEVDGVPTLVSMGGSAISWQSGIYRYTEPMNLAAAAWDLAATKLTPPDGFKYSLHLEYWTSGSSAPSLSTMNTAVLAANSTPAGPRSSQAVAGITDVVAIRWVFTADVKLEAYFHEQHDSQEVEGSLGRPLLRSIGLVEKVPSALEFYSLQELLLESVGYHLFEQQGGPAKRLMAQLAVSANLSHNEHLAFTVHSDKFDYVEARLRSEEMLRPPRSESE